MDYVVGSMTSREAWMRLNERYATISRSHVMQLKTDLYTITKGMDSVEKYLMKITRARNQLDALGVRMEDEDIVVVLLNGLPAEFNLIKAIIRARKTPITMQELRIQLLAAERDIANRAILNIIPAFSATRTKKNVSQKCLNGNGNNISNRSENGRGYRNNFRSPECQICRKKGHTVVDCFYRNDIPPNHLSNSVIICQICGLKGHAALDCHHRLNYAFQGSKPPSTLTAMIARNTNGASSSDASTSAHGFSYLVRSVGTSSPCPSSATLPSMMPIFGPDKLQGILPINSASSNSLDTHIGVSPAVVEGGEQNGINNDHKMWPQRCTVNSFMCDKSSIGIPLHSFSMDKRAAGVPPTPSDSSLQVCSVRVGASSMPWQDPVNKSFSLASSIPAPKLVSGSFNISSGSKQSYRVVHEPDGRDNDQTTQTTFVNSKFQDMGLSSAIKASSITVEDASSTRNLTGLPSSTRASSILDSGWWPRRVWVAHLQEHRSAVNGIAISTDHSFFVSASDDSTVKVWDSRKLEKDILFRSRLTYHLRGCTQVVVGACDAKIHMFSVDYISRGLGNIVEKYSCVTDIKEKDTKEGAIRSLLNFSSDNYASQMVMYNTQNCGIHLWDVRTNSDSWTLKATPEEGPCENWIVPGSLRGVLTLWDMRFLILVNSWQYSAVCPVEKICLFLPPPNASMSAAARPLI